MSDVLRIVIVDDEPLARAVVREYLGAHAGVEVVAECGNGFEAVKAVTELSPDLLFLDVQMPKLSGFEVLELLGREVPVVFTTAYDQYALRAFEVHAVDYLLKPFSEDRFAEALSRARERIRARAAGDGDPAVDALADDLRPEGPARAGADPGRRAGARAAGRADRLSSRRRTTTSASMPTAGSTSRTRRWRPWRGSSIRHASSASTAPTC